MRDQIAVRCSVQLFGLLVRLDHGFRYDSFPRSTSQLEKQGLDWNENGECCLTLELKSFHRFLSFSRSSSNSFNLVNFFSFFFRLSSRKRCSNSRLNENNIMHYICSRTSTASTDFVFARLAADLMPLISARVRSNGFNFETLKHRIHHRDPSFSNGNELTRTTVSGTDSNPSYTMVHVPSSSTSSIVHS